MKAHFAALLPFVFTAGAANFPPFTAGKSTITFAKLPEQAQPDEVKWCLRSTKNPEALDIAEEEFQLIVPGTYQHADKRGLFI